MVVNLLGKRVADLLLYTFTRLPSEFVDVVFMTIYYTGIDRRKKKRKKKKKMSLSP